MNIWYLHHHATPYEIAGVHRPFEFGEYWEKEGHHLTVFISSYFHWAGYNMINDHNKVLFQKCDGIDTVFVKTSSYKGSGLKRAYNMVEFWRRVTPIAKKLAKKKGKPDIILASSPQPLTMLAGLKLAKKFGVPCICEIRDFWPEVFFLCGVVKEKSLFGRIMLREERRIYERADGLLFLKEGDHTYITDKGWDIGHGGKVDMAKCSYVNNGVDLARFDKNKSDNPYEDADLDTGKFTVVYCGSIRAVNNLDLLLNAAKLVPEASFLLYGDGTCVKDLHRRIDEEKINNVKLKGYVDNKYVSSILSRSSLNILNYSGKKYNWSRGNSSNKLFEYLASGKPVVSTVKMGYDLIERYGCGYSVSETTPEQIAEMIKKVMALSPEEYSAMCLNARRAAEDFDAPKLANKYLQEMERVLASYKARKGE